VPWPDSTRVRARLELEVGEDPDRRVPSVSEHEKEKRRGARADWAGGGAQAAGLVGPCGRKMEERKKGRLGLGRVEENERGKRKRRREWAGPKEKKEKKRIAFKYFEFEFKI
jgi:hypothetical protein